MAEVAQVCVQVFCSSRVYEVTRIRGGGSVFNPDSDYDHMSNAEISKMLYFDDDHEDNNAGEEELTPSLA
jgi:hypothetical protein